MKQDIKQELGLPEGIDAKLDGAILVLKGFKGEFSRDFKHPKVELVVEGTNIIAYDATTDPNVRSYVATFAQISAGTSTTTGAVTASLINRTGWL